MDLEPSARLSFKTSRCCPGRTCCAMSLSVWSCAVCPKAQRDEIARKHIAEVGLTTFESSYPHQLSGGMRQRVGLARALTVDADIILMDEPFSSVDEQTRRKFQEELLDLLRHKNKTVIFVTHSIEEAAYLSDRIIPFIAAAGNDIEDHPAQHRSARKKSRRDPPGQKLSRYG